MIEGIASLQLIYMYFAVSAASEMLNIFFKEFNMFQQHVNKTQVQISGEKYAEMVKYESFCILLISAFEFPTFTLDDIAPQYLFLVPGFASIFTLGTIQKAATPQPGMNGAVVKETALDKVSATIEEVSMEQPFEKSAPETTSSEEAAQESAAETTTSDEAAQESADETTTSEEAAQKTAAKTTTSEEAAHASPAETTTSEEAAHESAAETTTREEAAHESATETTTSEEAVSVEPSTSADPDAADSAAVQSSVVKDDPVVAKLICMLTSLSGNLLNKVRAVVNPVFNPVFNLAFKSIDCLRNLPWCSIITCTTTNGSFLLAAFAWFHLTQNQLALLLPVLTLLLPGLIDQAGTRIPSPYR